MAQIHFNRIYIIESLGANDKKTGTDLHNDLLSYQSLKHDDFQSILLLIQNKNEWNNAFKKIQIESKENNISPIIHFEVHGSSDHKGLVLASGELIIWEELYKNLVPINVAIKNELFITMAVCHGLFTMSSSYINRTTPFRGIVGSYEEIYESDLQIRFYEFYEELFRSFDLNQAFDKLVSSNTGLSGSYKCYSAEEIFALAYTEYLRGECSDNGLRKRAKEMVTSQNIQNRSERRRWEREFIKMEVKKRPHYFKEAYNQYFMIDIYPDLSSEIGFECSIESMNKWLQSRI